LLTNATIAVPPKKLREAERRKAHPTIPRGAVRCCHLRALRARKRPDVGGRSPSGAPTAALAKATERSGSAQAALRAKERTPALPASSVALKRSTPRPGHNAGGDDARAARGRGYKPRPQEPHSLHRSAVAGDVPSTSETPRHVTLTATEVKQCLLFSDQMQPLRLGERCRKMLRLVIFKAYL